MNERNLLSSSGEAVSERETSQKFSSGTTSGTSAKNSSDSIDVMSYNIHHGEGVDENYNLRRVAGDIWASDPDIVGLQELDWNFLQKSTYDYSRSNFDKQIELLSDWLDMDYVFADNINLSGVPASNGEPRKYGIGILSKYEITDSKHTLLPTDTGNEQRGLLGTKIDINGTTLWFGTTHLGLDVNDRRKQVDMILDIMSDIQNPKILVGDFNAKPKSLGVIWDMINDYCDVFKLLGEAENTIPVPYQGNNLEDGRRIDYIFCSRDISPREATVIRTISSDHLPIAATVDIV